jgi:hypothetical protein
MNSTVRSEPYSATLRPAAIPRRAVPNDPARLEREHVAPRRPVVLDGVSEGWPARGWSMASLAEGAGDVPLPVAATRDGALHVDMERGLVFHARTLGDFVRTLDGAPDGYLIAPLASLPDRLRRDLPEPAFCRDAAWRSGKLWIGAAGVVSALHFDLADNLHTVLSGRKRFLLFAPDESPRLYPCGLRSGMPNGAHVDPERPDLRRFPRYAGARPLVAEVGPGETLYIPRGVWHHVRTLEPTVSVNWWWARGARAALVAGADLFKRLRGISR